MKQSLLNRPDQLKIFKALGNIQQDYQCLSARSLDNEVAKYRVGHFSPNPFKHFEDTFKDVKIRPVIIRNKNPFKTSPKSSGITIRLPEVSDDGTFRLNKYHFPPIKNAKSAKIINEFSEAIDGAKKEGKITEKKVKNSKKNMGLEMPQRHKEEFDLSFGVIKEDTQKINPFLSFN